MKILALDYGEKRVGMAVADTALGVAFPKGIIKNTPTLLKDITDFCVSEQVEKIFLGYPLPLSGKRGHHVQQYETFADQLEDYSGIAVELYCERFSTLQAEKSLQHLGERCADQKGKKDDMAAAIFLQEYLDAQ